MGVTLMDGLKDAIKDWGAGAVTTRYGSSDIDDCGCTYFGCSRVQKNFGYLLHRVSGVVLGRYTDSVH